MRAQAPAAVLETIDADNLRLAQSGLVERALRAGGAPGLRPGRRHRQDGGLETPALARTPGPQFLPWCMVSLLQPRTAGLAAAPARAGTARRHAGRDLAADAGCVADARPKARAGLPGAVGSGHRVARQFGIVFTLDEGLRPVYEAFGVDLLAHNGDSSFELPVPATYLIDRDATVAGAWVDVDYRRRAEPSVVLARLRELSLQV